MHYGLFNNCSDTNSNENTSIEFNNFNIELLANGRLVMNNNVESIEGTNTNGIGTQWVFSSDLTDNDKLDIKSSKQVFEESKGMMDSLMRKRFEEQDIDFRDELDVVFDEFEEQKYLETGKNDGPGPDDTIH